MNPNNLNTIEFFLKCATDYTTPLERYNFVREVTNNFGNNELVLLYKELCDFGIMLEFKYFEEVNPNFTKEGEFEYADGFVSKKDPNKRITGYSFAKQENDKWFVEKKVRFLQYITEEVSNIGESVINATLSMFSPLSIKGKVILINNLIPDSIILWRVDSLQELETLILDRIEKKEKGKTKEKGKKPLNFSGLFKPEYRTRIETFFNRLIANGYIDKDHIWKESELKNEPAKVYFWLVDSGVIIPTIQPTPALICFCKEFGITAYKDNESTPTDIRAVTVKNLLKAKNTISTADKKLFENIFSSFLITK